MNWDLYSNESNEPSYQFAVGHGNQGCYCGSNYQSLESSQRQTWFCYRVLLDISKFHKSHVSPEQVDPKIRGVAKAYGKFPHQCGRQRGKSVGSAEGCKCAQVLGKKNNNKQMQKKNIYSWINFIYLFLG